MCTAQVLLVSDVMRPSYNLQGQPQGGVCRRLFANEAPAAEDRPSLYAALQAKLEEQHRRQTDRWNFDFRTETPLPGRYQWVRPESQQRVPSNGSRVATQVATSSRKRRALTTSRKPLQATQSKITDFLHCRKRPRSSDSSPYSRKPKSVRTESGCRQTSSMTRPMVERTSTS